MRAIRVNGYGGPEVMQMEDVATPTPGPGEALVRIEASGVNFIDVYQRTGLYKIPVPFTPGLEAAGTVIETGTGVDHIQPGDRVAYQGVQGAYADFAVAPVDKLIVLPAEVTAREGAALMLQGMTAHYLATSTYHLQSGQWCLVQAAAGGVGLLLCQIARLIGARVIGTTSSEEKAALARDAGAEEVINYTTQDFEAETRRITGGAGVSVVYDSVGRTTFDKSLNCVSPRGMLVLFGQSSGPVPPVDLQILNQRGSLYVTRPTLASYVATREELVQRASEVMGWVRDCKLTVRIGEEFPLDRAADAHRDLEGRRTTGKVLLIP